MLARGAAETVLADLGRFGALALGPGLGGTGDDDLQYVVRTLVAEARPPLVLDADGLNALAGDFTSLAARRTLGAPAVLTPHAGEYERLMGATGRRRPAGGGPRAGRPSPARSCC